jgi:signal transduction histidine kinase
MAFYQRFFSLIADKFRLFFLLFGFFVYSQTPKNNFFDIFVLALYGVYLIVLEATGLRKKKNIFWRFARLNFDYFYLDYLCVNHEKFIQYGIFFYLLSLLTAVNYERNRHYFVCAALISFHVFTCFYLLHELNFGFLIFLTCMFFLFSAVLYSDEYRYNLSLEKISLSQNFVSNLRSAGTPNKMAKNMLWRIAEFSNPDIAALYLNSGDQAHPSFFPFHCIGIKADDELVYITKGNGIAGRAISTKSVAFVETNASKTKEYVPFRTGAKDIEAVLAIPILDSKEIYGVMILEFKKPSPLTSVQCQAIAEFLKLLTPIVREVNNEIGYSQMKFSLENRLRGQLLAIRKVAHDIRNYMNPFVEMPEYLMTHKREEWDKDHILDMAKVLQDVTHDFETDLNRCLEGKDTFTPAYQEFSLEELKEIIVETFKIRCRQKLVQLIVEVGKKTTEKVFVDQNWLLAIIENALSNSAKAYGKKGNGWLEVRLQRLHAHNHHFIQKGFEIVITDRAGGIPQATADKLSDNQRGHMSEVGEGLNIIKRYTLEMNGRVKCNIIKEKPGTQLIIALPDPTTVP